MNRDIITQELQIVEAEVEKAKAQLYRLDGIAAYLRGKLKEMDDADREILERSMKEKPETG